MTTTIECESEKLVVDTCKVEDLIQAMLFKAKHIKAKAEPCLFEAVAEKLAEANA